MYYQNTEVKNGKTYYCYEWEDENGNINELKVPEEEMYKIYNDQRVLWLRDLLAEKKLKDKDGNPPTEDDIQDMAEEVWDRVNDDDYLGDVLGETEQIKMNSVISDNGFEEEDI